jgi:isoquinoline 1-oxidoreductase beta subunit
VNVDAQLTGGVIWGLSHAMLGELTYADGAAEQTNFHTYPSLRLYQAPQVVAMALQTTGRVKGIGEPGVPPAAPALANAIFAATGQRIRELPLRKHIAFV